MDDVQFLIAAECDALKEMLLEKNRKYGNVALEPVRIASRASPVEQLLVRIDDKLSRLRAAQTDEDEDVWLDLMGYIVLLRVAKKLEAAENQPPRQKQRALVDDDKTRYEMARKIHPHDGVVRVDTLEGVELFVTEIGSCDYESLVNGARAALEQHTLVSGARAALEQHTLVSGARAALEQHTLPAPGEYVVMWSVGTTLQPVVACGKIRFTQ